MEWPSNIVKDDPTVVFQMSVWAKIVSSIAFLSFNLIFYFYSSPIVFIGCLITSGIAALSTFGIQYRIHEHKVKKYFFKYLHLEVPLYEIKMVEFYSIKKLGQLRINIASPDEDEYRLWLRNGAMIKIPAYYVNKQMTVGEYLCERHRIRKKVTKKMKFITWNP